MTSCSKKQRQEIKPSYTIVGAFCPYPTVKIPAPNTDNIPRIIYAAAENLFRSYPVDVPLLIYQYHFNVEIKDDKYDFDKQFEIVWHETQTPYRSYRTDFQVGDTIVFDSHKNYITSCLGSGLSEDQMNDNTYYKNYRAFDEPKLIITKVEKNFENTQKTRLLVKNPNATDQTVFRIMWEFDCWGGKYELLPAGSTDEEDTPPPIIHPRKTNRFGGKRKSRRTRQKNTHRRSRKR